MIDWQSDLVQRLIRLALDEDLSGGDITAACIFSGHETGRAEIFAKEPLIFCGGPILKEVIATSGRSISLDMCAPEGALLQPKEVCATLTGLVTDLVSLERTFLNFLQRLSGVSTYTRRFVDQAYGLTVLDTRKTMPGWRILDKYAVSVGGGKNHRMNLWEMVLIKNNHLDAWKGNLGGFAKELKDKKPSSIPLEVEVRTLLELQEVITHLHPEMIMFDNMSDAEVRQCLDYVKQHAPSTKIEVSGGITVERCRALAQISPDLLVSVGALTTRAPNVDISMKVSPR